MSEAVQETTEPKVHVMSREEAWERFDRQARRLLGMSAEEFLRAYDAGEISNDPETDEVTTLEMMLPLVR